MLYHCITFMDLFLTKCSIFKSYSILIYPVITDLGTRYVVEVYICVKTLPNCQDLIFVLSLCGMIQRC